MEACVLDTFFFRGKRTFKFKKFDFFGSLTLGSELKMQKRCFSFRILPNRFRDHILMAMDKLHRWIGEVD